MIFFFVLETNATKVSKSAKAMNTCTCIQDMFTYTNRNFLPWELEIFIELV